MVTSIASYPQTEIKKIISRWETFRFVKPAISGPDVDGFLFFTQNSVLQHAAYMVLRHDLMLNSKGLILYLYVCLHITSYVQQDHFSNCKYSRHNLKSWNTTTRFFAKISIAGKGSNTFSKSRYKRIMEFPST